MSYRSWSVAVGLMFLILSLLVEVSGKVKTISRLPGFSTTVIYAPPVLDFFERGDGSQITALTPPLIYKYAWGGRDFFKEAR
jgi:hypothetical protein